MGGVNTVCHVYWCRGRNFFAVEYNGDVLFWEVKAIMVQFLFWRNMYIDEHVRTRAHTLITLKYRNSPLSFFIDEHVRARYARAHITHRIQ
jgi:hypothetical protein